MVLNEKWCNRMQLILRRKLADKTWNLSRAFTAPAINKHGSFFAVKQMKQNTIQVPYMKLTATIFGFLDQFLDFFSIKTKNVCIAKLSIQSLCNLS